MNGAIGVALRLIQLIPLIIVGVFGFLQVVVKAFKETTTAAVNLLFPLFPDGGKFEKFVLKVRDFFNAFDAGLEVVKNKILIPLGIYTAK